MIEQVLMSEDGTRGVIREPVYPWQHVRKVGEDIVATELLFPTGHQLRPADLGALLTGGVPTVAVRKRPHLVIIPTGSELVDLDQHPDSLPSGKTIESNSAVLAALAPAAAAEIDPDDEAAAKSARKASGSYYTPRRIVDYMVNEALHLHLRTEFEKNAATPTDLQLLSQLCYELDPHADFSPIAARVVEPFMALFSGKKPEPIL